MKRDIILRKEDFHDFPIGEFPYDRDHTAAGEYHYIVEEGYRGVWYDPVCNYTYNGTGPTWIITEYQGVHYMESMRIEKNRPHRIFPTLETGEKEWGEYTVSVKLRRLSTKGTAGIVFCMRDSIDTLAFCLENRDRAVLSYRHKEDIMTLAEAEFPHGCDEFYLLEAICHEGYVDCRINGHLLFSVSVQQALRGGRVGITADCPSQFTDFETLVSTEEFQAIQERTRQAKELEETNSFACLVRSWIA